MEALRTLTGPIVLARTRATDLESVRKLNCWGSEIEDISVVRQMPYLEVCSLSVNDITTLKDFVHCKFLKELYVRNNKIENLWELCYLKDLTDLRILWLADNPCATGENYRMTVLRNLPHLQKLDNIVVQDEEIEAAKEKGEELSLPETENGKGGGGDGEGAGPETPPTVAANGDAGPSPCNTPEQALKDQRTLNWEETNKIRTQLGLKEMPLDKFYSPVSAPTSSTRHRNADVLQAVLLLVKHLDRDSLEQVDTVIRQRLDTL